MIRTKIKTWAWRLTVGCAIISLGLNVYLARRLLGGYEQQLVQDIWPVASRPMAVTVAADGPFQHTILLFGDSRMAQWRIEPPPGMRVVNAGVPGATTAELQPSLAGLLDKFDPDCAVIQAGINDLKFLGMHPELSNELVALVFTNLSAMTEQGLAHHCRVILLPVWPTANPPLIRWPVWSTAIPAAVANLNQRLTAAMANRDEVKMPDLFSEAGISPGAKTYQDTLHLRPETYSQLTPLLMMEIAGSKPK